MDGWQKKQGDFIEGGVTKYIYLKPHPIRSNGYYQIYIKRFSSNVRKLVLDFKSRREGKPIFEVSANFKEGAKRTYSITKAENYVRKLMKEADRDAKRFS